MSWSTDLVCVPIYVFDRDKFLDIKDEKDIEELCELFDTAYTAMYEKYKKEKYNPEISDKEYLFMNALSFWAEYHESYKATNTLPQNGTPQLFYLEISWGQGFLGGDFSLPKQRIQERLDFISYY